MQVHRDLHDLRDIGIRFSRNQSSPTNFSRCEFAVKPRRRDAEMHREVGTLNVHNVTRQSRDKESEVALGLVAHRCNLPLAGTHVDRGRR